MQEMRDEAKAEEQQIAEERACSEARLEPVVVLNQRVRELPPPTLPATVALGPHATVREALDIMREQQLSCVLKAGSAPHFCFKMRIFVFIFDK